MYSTRDTVETIGCLSESGKAHLERSIGWHVECKTWTARQCGVYKQQQ